jgi:hypothetical protein
MYAVYTSYNSSPEMIFMNIQSALLWSEIQSIIDGETYTVKPLEVHDV